MLKHVTIASGGVIPRIHPELLVRKKGGKVVLPTAPKPVATSKPAVVAKTTNLMKTTNKKTKAAAAATTKAADKGPKKGGKRGKAVS
jgi:histone H2A